MSTRVTLTATEGPFEGSDFEFSGHTLCTIGRSHDCGLCLTTQDPDLTISRRHCLLEIDPPIVRLHDLGSRNGTFVNGETVGQRRRGTSPSEAPPADTSPRTLLNGDCIRLGGTAFLVAIEKDAPDPAAGHPEECEQGEGTNAPCPGDYWAPCC
ncbi:MAG TPA: FHA domain-containing protein [Gemmataceae bacterium]|nr:FHA domain-containing protein [Gemmataceae bacterium]